MSVVAWDGRYLAADMQATVAEMRVSISKIRRIKSGEVVAWTGAHEHGLRLMQWYVDGADPLQWPEFQRGEHWTRLIVAGPDGVKHYEQEPVAQEVHNPFMAWGSGRDFAMGAMAAGANAEAAVCCANRFNIHCGCGVELFDTRNPMEF